MGIILNESSKIIQALDREAYNQIAVDKTSKVDYGFDGGKWSKSKPEEKLEQEKTLIKRTRAISKTAKVETCLMDIVNEAVVPDSKNPVVVDTSDIESVSMSDSVLEKAKEGIETSFSRIIKKMNFKKKGTSIFMDWYVDGRLYVYVEWDNNKKEGITGIRFLDPLKLKLVYKKDSKSGKKHFVYEYTVSLDENGEKQDPLEIPYKNVLFIPSGLTDTSGVVISYLNKALRPLNLLNMMENSLVIQRFVRAPSRWVFKIDVSGMNKKRAKSYMNNLQSKYRSRFRINAVTGELNSNNMTLAMQENFWLPKTNSQNGGHEIDEIGGNQNLGDIDDILYWKKEVDSSLNVVPENDENSIINFGSRLEEISRKEFKFFRFIKWIRTYFNILFTLLLKIESVFSNTLTIQQWEEIKGDIFYIYENDSIYESAKKRQKNLAKLEDAQAFAETALRWYGEEWFRTNILEQTPEEQKKFKEDYEKRKAEKGGEEEEEEF